MRLKITMRESQLRLAIFIYGKFGQFSTRYANPQVLRNKSIWLFFMLLCCSKVYAEEESFQHLRLQVAEPFIELHTGPGRGFPIFHVVERHGWIDIIKRRTDWFRIRTPDGKEGWTYIDQLEMTLALPGRRTEFAKVKQEDFEQRKVEFGALAGDFEGAALMTLYNGYNLSKNLSAEIALSQASGTFTNNLMLGINLLSSPFPSWRVSPYFTIGGGVIRNEPKGTFVNSKKTSDATASAGFGIKAYITRRFVFRAEAREVVAFIDQDNNGEFVEWKLGFSFFF